MNNKIILLLILILLIGFSCTKIKIKTVFNNDVFKVPMSKEKIPEDIIWLSNESDPVFSSNESKKGGVFNSYILNFPNTLRTVGPDANSSFRDFISNNQLSLINLHPDTDNIIPELAEKWAFDKDHKTMYFQLNKNAKWSDGNQVTSQDFAFTLVFMRSKEIVDPWYNDFYSNYIDKVVIYDDYTLAVSAKRPLPDLYLYLNLQALPRHFYGKLGKDFITKYNWVIVPNTGAYQIKSFIKGKQVVFERKKYWWAFDLKYYRNRFNVDKVIFNVYKDELFTWEYLKKSKIDALTVNYPEYWYDKTKDEQFVNGYINKIWFYTDTEQPSRGIFLNQDFDLFKDINARLAFNYAMNIEKVIEKIYRNDFSRLPHDFTGYGKYSNTNIKPRTFDIQKVEYYMKKSGWKRGNDGIWTKDGKRFSVEVTYTLDSDTSDLVLLKEEALKAGIELQLDKLDYYSRYKKIMEKKHEASWSAWSTDVRPEYWQGYHSDNAHKTQTNNITNTDNKELDKLIDKYRFSINEKERIALSQVIQQKLFDIACFIPTYMRPYVRMVYWRWWKLPEIPGTKNSKMYFEIDESLFDPFSTRVGGLFWFDEQSYKETQYAMKKHEKFKPVSIINEKYKN